MVTDPRTAVTGTRGITGTEATPTRVLEATAGAFQIPCRPLHLVPAPWALSELLPRGPQTSGGACCQAVGTLFPQQHGDSAQGWCGGPGGGTAGPRLGSGRARSRHAPPLHAPAADAHKPASPKNDLDEAIKIVNFINSQPLSAWYTHKTCFKAKESLNMDLKTYSLT